MREDFKKNSLIENYNRIVRAKNQRLDESEQFIGNGSLTEDTNADRAELANLIYDTLMRNRQHPQFDLTQVSDQEIDPQRGTIEFNYGEYIRVKLVVDVTNIEGQGL